MQEKHGCSSLAELQTIWEPVVVAKDAATTSSLELLSQALEEIGHYVEDISPEKVAEYKEIWPFDSATQVFSTGHKIRWIHKIMHVNEELLKEAMKEEKKRTGTGGSHYRKELEKNPTME